MQNIATPLALALVLATSPVRADPPATPKADDSQAPVIEQHERDFIGDIDAAGKRQKAEQAEQAVATEVPPPRRELDFVKMIEDARKQQDAAHPAKDVRIALQIRVLKFYNESDQFEGWRGVVQGIHVSDNGDVWLSIKIADGITIATSPTLAEDPNYVTLIRGDSAIAKVAAKLRLGQQVQFTATLMRYVNDSDSDMINNPRLLGHFTALKPLR